MKSNVFKMKKGELNLKPILTETEKVTAYNGLPPRAALSLRLLAEELVGMLPAIVNSFDGEFWIETEGSAYELHVRMAVSHMDLAKRESLIKLASNNKNASVVGITGKIRAVFDYMVLGGDESAKITPVVSYGFVNGGDYAHMWSLNCYRDTLGGDGTEEKWDELEKSIIAKLADDVIVGVQGKTVTMIIKKSFEENER